MFAACDSNGDDRMDIFEARAAMESTGSPTEIQWYRRLDQDRDGYLSWPEFDRFYRVLVQSGNSLQLTLARGLKAERSANPTHTKPAPEPIQQAIVERCQVVMVGLAD